ncbi:hypothetical protein [Halostagnicola bangensis]
MSDSDSAADRIEYRKRNAVDPETFLLDLEVVEPTERGENLRFAPEFTERIETQLECVRVDGVETSDVATMFGANKDDVTDPGREYTAYKIHATVRNWPSDAALELDVATDRELQTETDRWADVPGRQRYNILQSLRSFHDECPFCNGEVSISDETVESCCGDLEVVTVNCRDCGRRLLEFSADAVPDA